MRRYRHLISAGFMVAGSLGIFGTLYWMNEHGTLAPPTEASSSVAFEVAPPPPQTKPKPQRQERKRSDNKSVTPKIAPTPSLGAGLAGISFDLPGFESSDLGNVGNELIEGAAKNTVMTEDSVDKKPVPRTQGAPAFPDKARQRGIEGYVKLNLFINTSGAVEKVRVLEAEPKGIFEESAIAAAQSWEFEPAEYNGGAVNGWFKRTVSFRLN